MINLTTLGVAVALLALFDLGPGAPAPVKPAPTAAVAVHAAGIVDRFEVLSRFDAWGGATPAGAAGPYVVVTGIVHGRLLPGHPDNAGIVDLDRAPRDADGYVDYTTDVTILRPRSAATARRVLFYDVANRGGKPALAGFIGTTSLLTGAVPDANASPLLRAGYTVVWSGWQANVRQTGDSAVQPLGVEFPIAAQADGSSITGLTREEYVAKALPPAPAASFALSYLPASLDDMSEVRFTARQTWVGRDGKQLASAPSVPVANWHYVDNGGASFVEFTAPAAVPTADGSMVPADAGTIYEFVYRAKNPVVAGIGFAAVRDLVGFLKNASVDDRGNPNPLADLRGAACASGIECAARPATNFDVAIGAGTSQSGRFLRDFLYRGFNKDGHGAKVFDGLMLIVAGARRTWVDERFAQPGRWSTQHDDHWMPGDQYPFAYGVSTDPVGGSTDGLMKRCLATATCPKIMQVDGSFEWWNGRGSLIVTDGAGHDVALPDNVRYYYVAGTAHGGGEGVTTGVVRQPAANARCQLAASPVAELPVERALLPALESWIVKGALPPASSYPSVSAGTLAQPERAAVGFPDLSDVSVPYGPAASPAPVNLAYFGAINQLFVTDYGHAMPVTDPARQYTLLVSRVDANGNELGGIRMPEIQVPLATYTGWNIRAAGNAIGEGCGMAGSAIPFAANPQSRAVADPRTTLAQLYRGRADYRAHFDAAADALERRGYLSARDADALKAGAANISPALIPAP